MYTGFLGDDLRRMYDLFGLANIADVHDIIRSFQWSHTRDKFHAEELFLFLEEGMEYLRYNKHDIWWILPSLVLWLELDSTLS